MLSEGRSDLLRKKSLQRISAADENKNSPDPSSVQSASHALKSSVADHQTINLKAAEKENTQNYSTNLCDEKPSYLCPTEKLDATLIPSNCLKDPIQPTPSIRTYSPSRRLFHLASNLVKDKIN